MLTKEEAACITAVTGSVMLEARYFKAEVEKKLQRAVFPAEFNNEAFREEVKNLFWDDFVKLCYQEEKSSGLILPSTSAMP